MAKKRETMIVMRKESFDAWLSAMKQKHGDNPLNWPASAREWYRSITIKEPNK